MVIKPRWYQQPLIDATYEKWNSGFQNVGMVAPCRSGKSYTMGFIAREFNQRQKYVVQFAHRDVLLSQLSISYANLGIRHNLMCNTKAKKFIANLHVEELGQCFYDERATVTIASTKTYYNANTINIDNKIGLSLMDECHHSIADNQSGKVILSMENAYHLGVTATFCRLDNKGLGRKSHGVYDTVVSGVTAHDLFQTSDLCKYRIVATKLSKQFHHDIKQIKQGREYDPEQKRIMLNDTRRNVVGDVVGTYKKHAMGLSGLTFCQDIDACEKMAMAYRAAGVSAISLSSNNSNDEIWEGLRLFRAGKVLQICNCKLFGEGFDTPICYSVSFVNPTKSYTNYTQEFFRGLTNAPGKKYSWIFDHVGNIEEHGLPDHGLNWEDYLHAPADRPKRKNDTESAHKTTTCVNPECNSDYFLPASVCPWCGTPYQVVSRKPLKTVDGELVELTQEELNRLRGKRRVVEMSPEAFKKNLEFKGMSHMRFGAMIKNHNVRLEIHEELKILIDEFAMQAYDAGLSVSQAQHQFNEMYGHCIDSVHSLNTVEARKLIDRLTCENL